MSFECECTAESGPEVLFVLCWCVVAVLFLQCSALVIFTALDSINNIASFSLGVGSLVEPVFVSMGW